MDMTRSINRLSSDSSDEEWEGADQLRLESRAQGENTRRSNILFRHQDLNPEDIPGSSNLSQHQFASSSSTSANPNETSGPRVLSHSSDEEWEGADQLRLESRAQDENTRRSNILSRHQDLNPEDIPGSSNLSQNQFASSSSTSANPNETSGPRVLSQNKYAIRSRKYFANPMKGEERREKKKERAREYRKRLAQGPKILKKKKECARKSPEDPAKRQKRLEQKKEYARKSRKDLVKGPKIRKKQREYLREERKDPLKGEKIRAKDRERSRRKRAKKAAAPSANQTLPPINTQMAPIAAAAQTLPSINTLFSSSTPPSSILMSDLGEAEVFQRNLYLSDPQAAGQISTDISHSTAYSNIESGNHHTVYHGNMPPPEQATPFPPHMPVTQPTTASSHDVFPMPYIIGGVPVNADNYQSPLTHYPPLSHPAATPAEYAFNSAQTGTLNEAAGQFTLPLSSILMSDLGEAEVFQRNLYLSDPQAASQISTDISHSTAYSNIESGNHHTVYHGNMPPPEQATPFPPHMPVIQPTTASSHDVFPMPYIGGVPVNADNYQSPLTHYPPLSHPAAAAAEYAFNSAQTGTLNEAAGQFTFLSSDEVSETFAGLSTTVSPAPSPAPPRFPAPPRPYTPLSNAQSPFTKKF